MKFLQHEDSVVSLKFKYMGAENPDSYEVLPEDKLTFDTIEEIQDSMTRLFPNEDSPFSLQEDILDLDKLRATGDYTQADITSRLAQFQNNLNGALSARGEYPDISDFMNALQEFVSTQAIDLSEFRGEASTLQTEVQQIADHVEAGAEAVLARESLKAELTETAAGLKREVTREGERQPDQPVMTVASTIGNLEKNLGTAKSTAASILAELDSTSVISSSNLAAGLASAKAMHN